MLNFFRMESGFREKMTEKNSLKSYRIGDFAEYMGVTPDFLKHYSENGLLDVHQRENGYRYYSLLRGI